MKTRDIFNHIFIFLIPAGLAALIACIALPVLAVWITPVEEIENETVMLSVLGVLSVLGACLATAGYYALLRKNVSRNTVIINAFVLILTSVVFTLLIVIGAVFEAVAIVYLIIFFSMITALAVSVICFRRNTPENKSVFGKKTLAAVCAALAAVTALNAVLYVNRPEAKYSGHGFDYMNGYSSTDFTDYMVYSDNSKLVMLDHPASLRIDDPDEMPVMDGAEACYPVYAAAAKAVYKDIDVIEKQALENNEFSYFNGKIVSFTNTITGFSRLTFLKDQDSRVDLFFGARPSRDQLANAERDGVELEITPIGKEAFVFFVVKDNPVDDLTADQLRGIYHGDITNWLQLGGKNREIKAFQRPANSGSQTMMEYFMGDVPLKEPDTYETIGGMGDVIKEVAQYNSEPGAMGYTFRYFLEGLNQEDGVKMLSVDGVYPTVENIKNGSYPLTVDLCLITRKDDPNPNVRKMIDFMLSEDGQYIVEQTGYAPLGK